MRIIFNIIPRQFLRYLVLSLIPHKYLAPFVARLCERHILKANQHLMSWQSNQHKKSCITVLALNASRFRGELEALEATGDFVILRVPFQWQGRLYSWFYAHSENCFDAFQDKKIRSMQDRYRYFLRIFLNMLYSRLDVDVVLGAAIHYKVDYDWGAITHQIGVPFVVLHREGIMASKAACQIVVSTINTLKWFQGTKLLVHNDIQRRIFIENSYVTEDNCIVVGNPRMDSFIQLCKDHKRNRSSSDMRRKKLTLFSFGPGVGIYTAFPPHWPVNWRNYLFELCRKTHSSVSRFAMDNPNIDVVIKPKWGGDWVDNMIDMIKSDGVDVESISNISIDPYIDVYDLLKSTDVVVGCGSTTLLESAILGLPVIIPFFAEAREWRFKDDIMFREDAECFEWAYSPDDLYDKIARCIVESSVPNETMNLRRAVFEKYVSPMDASATNKVKEIILECHNRRQGK